MEKQILFNTEMVQAILENRKTSTRRIAKFKPYTSLNETNGDFEICEPVTQNFFRCRVDFEKWAIAKCRYKVGNILYVRETWKKYKKRIGSGENCCIGEFYGYKADENNPNNPSEFYEGRWRPSIHMPKEAARIFLKVTDVRIERLQDMKYDDYLEEGTKVIRFATEEELKKNFTEIWNGTLKKGELDMYGWGANPWVWVIEFEKIDKDNI